MPEVSNAVLKERIDHILERVKQITDVDIPEMKNDIKITKEQALKTNGRVNRHDDEIKSLQETAQEYVNEREAEHQETISEYKKKWEMVKTNGFKFAVATVLAIAAANQLPELVIKFIQFFTSLYG